MKCDKCNNPIFKYFDIDYYICAKCGTLKAKPVEPEKEKEIKRMPKTSREKCSVEDCENLHHAKGYCDLHYTQLVVKNKANATPEPEPGLTKEVVDALLETAPVTNNKTVAEEYLDLKKVLEERIDELLEEYKSNLQEILARGISRINAIPSALEKLKVTVEVCNEMDGVKA